MKPIGIAVDSHNAVECSEESVDQMVFGAVKLVEFDCKFDWIVYLVEMLFGSMYCQRCVERMHLEVERILLVLKQIGHHKQLWKWEINRFQ